jgi:hypothetical protein
MESILWPWLGILIIYVLLSFIPRRRLPEERGLSVQYQTICAGVRRLDVGFLRLGSAVPFWRVSFYERFAVIAILLPTAVEYSEFDSVQCRNYMLFKSITFRSEINGLNFSAWVLSAEPIIKILQDHGVHVK